MIMDTLKAPSLSLAIRIVGCVMTALCGLQCSAADSSVRTLSLNDCFQRALQHNLDLQIERHQAVIQEAQLRGSLGAYDPTFRFGALKSRLDAPGQFDSKKGPGRGDNQYELDSDILSAGIGGLLPTGTRYDVGTEMTRWRNKTDLRLDPAFSGILDEHRTNEFGLRTYMSLSQPLLKNFWIDGERLAIQVNRKNLKISELSLLKKIMTVVGDVQGAYLEATFAQEALRIQQQSYESSKKLLSDVHTRIQAGALPPLEEKMYQFHFLNMSADVVSAEKNSWEAQAALRNLITDDLKEWVGTSLDLTDPLTEIEEQFNQVECWRDAMTKRPEVLQMHLDLEKQDIVLRYDRNQLFPSLDLVGSYGFNGIDPSLANAGSQVSRGDHGSYSYGVTMSVPIGNRNSRSKYRADQETRKQMLLRVKQAEMQILTEVENAGRQMSASYRRIDPSKKARDMAEQVLKSEESKILLVQTTSPVVVEARRRLTANQLSSFRAIVDYNKARAQLALSQGEILERNGISVNFK